MKAPPCLLPIPSQRRSVAHRLVPLVLVGLAWLLAGPVQAAELSAGVARADITDRRVPVNDPLYAKALVVKSDSTTVVLITIDAVAIGELGRIKNDFLGNIRSKLKQELGIAPSSVLITASHCHGLVCLKLKRGPSKPCARLGRASCRFGWAPAWGTRTGSWRTGG